MEYKKDIFSDPWVLSREIFDLSELGSSEFKSAALICDIMEKHGFKVERNYKNIPTSFRAEKVKGKGSHKIAFLAEYDALMGIGHACGHNLIAAANTFAAIRTADLIDDGVVVLIGTPDEEGTGDYAGSKAILAGEGAFSDLELVLGAHPGSVWAIAENSLAVQDLEITFKGYSSHEAANPEKGRSALDAAVLTYNAINMLRQHLRRDKNALIHGVIREGGGASNVTPDRAVMVYGVRSSSMEYHSEMMEKIETIIKGCSMATFTEYSLKKIGPVFSPTKHNVPLSQYFYSAIRGRGIDLHTMEESLSHLAGGSTDFANVTQVVPALEIHFKIAESGTPWHSELSMAAAISEEARESLNVIIDVLVEGAMKFLKEEKFRKSIWADFKSHD